jgi:aminoglycoside 2'-N-acetyltransferase I
VNRDHVRERALPTQPPRAAGLAQLLDLFAAAWPEGDFSPQDMEHACGGRHFLALADGRIVAHASVVERALEVDGRPLRTGYVEAVATLPAWQRRGIASRLMESAAAHVGAAFELGALSTGIPEFYERLGWRPWEGELFVRTADGPVPCRKEDEGFMVIPTPSTPSLSLRETLGCEWRPGDAW